MSYRERMTRKGREGKTPDELRRAMPDIYANQSDWRGLIPLATYTINPDGTLKEIINWDEK
jgi:hypothetical protein